ncbi:CHASE2 domain-containing protein [Ralstonia sp. 25C]|uniref:CHASE2 domain-containing protein n=1 Tax=Ralstonia sp. 25C TaxID=3447363 RepID=UPI003F74ECE8
MGKLISAFRRTTVGWQSLPVVLVLLVAYLGHFNGLGRVDYALYDAALSLDTPSVPSDVIIVEIDDKSLQHIGRWPWRRSVHAALIDKLTDAGARAIGLDVILVDADERNPADDKRLAEAIERSKRVVLPVVPEATFDGVVVRRPLESFQAELGHIDLQLDTDGVARSVALEEKGGDSRWPHFALAMLRAGGEAPARLPGRSLVRRGSAVPNGSARQADHRMQVRYAGPAGTFPSVSYFDVLRGAVPPGLFRDKYVIVGATASGMRDIYLTPFSSGSAGMSGVELIANVLNNIRHDTEIRFVGPLLAALLSIIPVALLYAGLVLLTPRVVLLWLVGLVGMTLGGSFLLVHAFQIWVAPAAALTGLVAAYPLWGWWRLEVALRYLTKELSRLNTEDHVFPDGIEVNSVHAKTVTDVLDRHMVELSHAILRLKNLRQFLTDALDSLPDAALVCDREGKVLFANQPAQRLFAATHSREQSMRLVDASLPALLAHAFDTPPELLGLSTIFEPANTAAKKENERGGASAATPFSMEIVDRLERDMLLKVAHLRSASGRVAAWAVIIVDISAVRQAERRREEAFRFVSHDMRLPQTSTLALVELQRHSSTAIPQDQFLDRVAGHARKTLTLADDFIHLARAESAVYEPEIVSFAEVVADACDEIWASANAKNIQVKRDIHSEHAFVEGERTMLSRAVANLLSNAVKFSPRGTTVRLVLERAEDKWKLSVSDEGCGIAPENRTRLFRSFERIRTPGIPDEPGCGLGLVFVKTVIERHGGTISVSSEPGAGSTFTVLLPCLDEAQVDASEPIAAARLST